MCVWFTAAVQSGSGIWQLHSWKGRFLMYDLQRYQNQVSSIVPSIICISHLKHIDPLITAIAFQFSPYPAHILTVSAPD